MNEAQTSVIDEAVTALKRGDVIAYPTEAVYGLGCDPFNHDAVTKLLQLKNRPIAKGFILIASDWEQVAPYVELIPPEMLARVLATWPGPHTWIFPVKPDVPTWLTGEHRSIAVRVTDHPIANDICRHFGGPITSTSANYSSMPPARDARTVGMAFPPNSLGYIVPGKVGSLTRPTEIRDAISGEILRKG